MKNIGQTMRTRVNGLVVLGLLLQVVAPLYAPTRSTHAESVRVHGDFNLKALLEEVIQGSIDQQSDDDLSPAVKRCYKQLIEGEECLDADDVIEMMPEVLTYALLKHNHDRASRPDAPTGLANNAIAGCGGDCDLTQLIQLLSSIRARIGTVKDSPCCDSILGILGDACNAPCIGEDGSISEVLCEILDCCTSLDISVTAEVDLSGVFTVLAELEDTLTECCAEIIEDIFDTQTIICDKFEQTWTILADLNISVTAEVDLSGVFTVLADLEDTLTECCAEIQEDIFDTQTIICDKFEQTWTILADLEDTLTECCAEIIEDIFDTQTIICDKFEQTWTILANLEISVTCDLTGVFTLLGDPCDFVDNPTLTFTLSVAPPLDLAVSIDLPDFVYANTGGPIGMVEVDLDQAFDNINDFKASIFKWLKMIYVLVRNINNDHRTGVLGVRTTIDNL